jgi:heat shock protein HspQ
MQHPYRFQRSRKKGWKKPIKELLAEEEDYLRPLVGLVVQEVLEAEMSEEQIEHPNLTSQFSEDAPFPDTQLLTISPREFRFTVEECSTA